MIPSIILSAIQLGASLLAALPDPDPEIRRLRAEHHQRMLANRLAHIEAEAEARQHAKRRR